MFSAAPLKPEEMKLAQFQQEKGIFELNWGQHSPNEWFYGVWHHGECFFYITEVSENDSDGNYLYLKHGGRIKSFETSKEAIRHGDSDVPYKKCQAMLFKDLEVLDSFWCNWMIFTKLCDDENAHYMNSDIRANSMSIQRSLPNELKIYIYPNRPVIKLIP